MRVHGAGQGGRIAIGHRLQRQWGREGLPLRYSRNGKYPLYGDSAPRSVTIGTSLVPRLGVWPGYEETAFSEAYFAH